jgi:nitroreductase
MIEKPAETDQKIAKVLAERWSGRAYDANLPVNNEQIIALCEAARWAPSCYGAQPWRFVIWNRYEDEDSWKKVINCLSPGNQDWAKNAPLLILAASVQTFSHNDSINRWAGYDSGAASISLCLQATTMGLLSHQMGGFDANKLKNTLSLPADIDMWAIIAIGHPAGLDSLNEVQLEREFKVRERSPLSTHFYTNNWGVGVKSGE